MKYLVMLAFAAITAAGGAQAADPAEGQKIFARRCATCHMVVTPQGQTVVKGGKTGPNQWGVVGRTAGSVSDFRGYGAALVAAGKGGLVWTEAEIVEYLVDPRAYLRARTGDSSAASRMAFKLASEEERANVASYLATLK
jgi:cytochrome c